MSLKPHAPTPVPEQTARIARAAFPAGNLYMRMRDALDGLYRDEDFGAPFPPLGQPALAPWRVALVTILQFAEDLPDRQAADAVRARIDWKYALGLELTDPGFDHTVLSEFRARLVAGKGATLLLDALLRRFGELGLLKARGRQRTDSTHVLAAVRALNRVELVQETMRHALEILAAVAPDWLVTRADPAWVGRYTRRAEDERVPKRREERERLVGAVGADGARLLDAVDAEDAPGWLRQVPAVRALRSVWIQNFLRTDRDTRWRTEREGLPPASRFLSSPYDLDAHLGKKGTTCWVGYKVCLSETCEDDAPNLITHVATTAAPIADGAVTPGVHEALHALGLLPRLHLVDTGFLDAELPVSTARDYGVELLGPTRKDQRWQARAAEGFGVEHFAVDFERETATCPRGHTSAEWRSRLDSRGNDSVYIRFSSSDCGPRPSRPQCTRSGARHPRRSISVRPQPQYEALQRRRELERGDEYRREYARRAGVEGAMSQGIRRCGMRRSRYVGLPKTHFQHVATAAAIDFVRVGEWLGQTPRATTRKSRFAALMAKQANE